MRALRAAYGTVLLLAPSTALWCIGSKTTRHPALVAVRVLGARHLAQAVVDPAGSRAGAAVDGLHAVSMGILAACAPRTRRAAAASALISCALAGQALGVTPVGRRSARARRA
jgi:hypothetical protein